MRVVPSALLLFASLFSVAAHADVEIDGIQYPTTLQLDGKPVQLNGAATKYNKSGVRNFSVAIYAMQRGSTAEALIAAPGPKRIAFKFLHPVSTDGMRFLTRGVETNLDRPDFVKAIGGVARLGGMLGSHPTFTDGDKLTLDYQPGVGTFITINERREAEPVREPEFFKAMLLIWVGARPVDAQMRAAILGG